MGFVGILITLLLFLSACSNTPPVKPSAESVEVSRKAADQDCESIGPVEGRSLNAKASFEEILEDLKKDAAQRGANYVQIQDSGAMGTSVRGQAYICR